MIKRYSRFLNLLSVVFISTVLFTSCGKDGMAGAEGPQGEKGIQGVQGVDGSTILNGSGKPALTIGKQGDFYLDLSTTDLYGPKQETSWGNPLSLKGSKGDPGSPGKDGLAGSQFLSGNGVPTTNLGANGDFYFDKANLSMYGPKINTSWGTPVSLKSANNSGVKVVSIKDFKFASNEEPVYYFSYDYGYGNAELNNTIMPVIDYADYYENGLVLVQLRDPKDPDGAWRDEIYAEVNNILDYPDSYGQIGLSVAESVSFRKTGINLDAYASIRLATFAGLNADMLNDEMNKLINGFSLDIKIVLIPGTQVQALKQQNVNTQNAKAVLKQLNIENRF